MSVCAKIQCLTACLEVAEKFVVVVGWGGGGGGGGGGPDQF